MAQESQEMSMVALPQPRWLRMRHSQQGDRIDTCALRTCLHIFGIGEESRQDGQGDVSSKTVADGT